MTASQPDNSAATESAPSSWRDTLRPLLREPRSVVGLWLVMMLFGAALIGPAIAPYHFQEMTENKSFESPGAEFYLGTDREGRDIFSRLLSGARVSLIVGLFATLLSVIIGVTIGLLAGYFGGWTDAALMRVTDTFYAFPSVLLAVAMAAIVEDPTIWHICMVLGLVG